MIRALLYGLVVGVVLGLVALRVDLYAKANRAPAKPETLTCVRVKEVTPAGTINYLCEVRK